jgi:DNA-binding response OmpR family regulator
MVKSCLPSLCLTRIITVLAKILLVDDDQDLAASLQAFLAAQGQTVEMCHTGEDALQLLQAFPYDCIVLDWQLPGISGEQVCQRFRAEKGQTPIIFLTGKTDINSIEAGLDAGADDYVVKPFNAREVYARIKANLKRSRESVITPLSRGGVTLEVENRQLTAGGKTLRLRAKEAALLEYLLRHPGRIFSSQQLLDAIWTADDEGTTDTVRTWMSLLRKKLVSLGCGELVRTVLGSGYTIEN